MLNALEEVYIPLTTYIVADENSGDEGELEGRSEYKINICVPNEQSVRVID